VKTAVKVEEDTEVAAQQAVKVLIRLKPDGVGPEKFLREVSDRFASIMKLDRTRGANRDAIDRALRRGIAERQILEEEEGGSRSSEELAEFLNMTRQAIDQRRKARKLIAWQDSAGHWRFPVWQLNRNGQPYDDLPPILDELPGDSWSDMIFFLSESEALKARPLDLLRKGQGKRVRVAAMRFGRHGA
jgi:hypothetical protein